MNISDTTSRSISIARVICIFFVMFVHVWPGTAQFDPSRGVRALDIFYHFITDVLGRSSVPLLTVISGWLIGMTYSGRWARLVASRWQSLIVPLFLWNVAMLAVLMLADVTGVQPFAWRSTSWLDMLLAATQPSVNIPLAFLRDLFICVLLAPALLWSVKSHPWAIIPLGVLAASYAIFGAPSIFLLRPMILMFFFFGLVLGARRIDIAAGAIRWPLVGAALAIVAVLFTFDIVPGLSGGGWHAPEIIMRAAVAYLFWCATLMLERSHIGAWLAQWAPHIFTVFCSHAIIMKLMIVPGRAIFGGYYDDGYVVYFFLQPIAAMIVGIGISCKESRYDHPIPSRNPASVAHRTAGRSRGDGGHQKGASQ